MNTTMSSSYTKLHKIGQGAFGTVYKCKHVSSGRFAAMKEIVVHDDHGIEGSTMREIGALKELLHPHIVELYDVFYERQKIKLVFEYIEYDLHRYIAECGLLQVGIVQRLMYQLLQGVNYLHMHGIHHRDLKPANLLVDTARGSLKIADFGMARAFDLPADKKRLGVQVCTLWYCAPEQLLGSTSYTTSVDAWSTGCIFGELLRGAPLFRGCHPPYDFHRPSQLTVIMRKFGTPSPAQFAEMKTKDPSIQIPEPFPQVYPRMSLKQIIPRTQPRRDTANAIDLLKQLLKFDPSERISASAALSHAYFNDRLEYVNPYQPPNMRPVAATATHANPH